MKAELFYAIKERTAYDDRRREEFNRFYTTAHRDRSALLDEVERLQERIRQAVVLLDAGPVAPDLWRSHAADIKRTLDTP